MLDAAHLSINLVSEIGVPMFPTLSLVYVCYGNVIALKLQYVYIICVPSTLLLHSQLLLSSLPIHTHLSIPSSLLSLHSALGGNYEEKLSQRLAQVHDEIEESGHYELTYGELAFGARTAWRNAPRCVNRIVWRQLEVCTTCTEVEITCGHRSISMHLAKMTAH